jgi:hypothetical protein
VSYYVFMVDSRGADDVAANGEDDFPESLLGDWDLPQIPAGQEEGEENADTV